jgi:hypothetical protein
LDQKVFHAPLLFFERCCFNIHKFGQGRTGIAKTELLLPSLCDFAKFVVLSRDRALPEITVD